MSHRVLAYYILIVFSTVFCCGRVGAYEYHFKQVDKQFDAIAQQLNKMDYENQRGRITLAQLAKLQHIADVTGNRQLQARTLYWRVRSSQMSAQPLECIKMLERARSLCSQDYDYDRACIDYQLAGNYERMGRYLSTYNLLNTTLPVFTKYGDNYFLGNAYLLQAQLFTDINDPENAKVALSHAKTAYTQDGYPLNRIYFFEAMLAGNGNKLHLYKKSIATGGVHDWGMTLQALSSICSLFLDKNMTDSAETYCNMAYGILDSKAPKNQVFRTIINISRIQVLYAQKRYDEAMKILREEEQKIQILKGERFLTDIYMYLWKVSEQMGNTHDAYKYLRLYQEEYERNNAEIRKQDIPKARAREAIARRNDTIRLFEQDAELSRGYMYVMILVTVVVVLVCVVLFIYFHQRYKIRKIENRELRNSLQHDALIYAVNRENFEQDIKQKDCEISSSTLLLANKNEVLQQISSITKRYLDDGMIPHEYVKQINNVIGDSLKNDDEWQRFKLHFDSVHPDFFVKLKEASGELTENDLRLCAYISIGMRAKQIAEMLSVSPDSINSNRYRLRKKLHLKRDDSLDDFIRRI